MLPICAHKSYENPETRSLMSFLHLIFSGFKYCPSLTLPLRLLLSLYPLLLVSLMKLDYLVLMQIPKMTINENNQISLYSKARVYNKLHWQQEKTPKKPNWLKQRLVTESAPLGVLSPFLTLFLSTL